MARLSKRLEERSWLARAWHQDFASLGGLLYDESCNIPPLPAEMANALNQHTHDWLDAEADVRDILGREMISYEAGARDGKQG